MAEIKNFVPDDKKSEVKVVYRRYYRNHWYQSDTPRQGYEKYYYATRKRLTMYHKDKEMAERDAADYNKRYAAYVKGTGKSFPKTITWDDMEETEVNDPSKWFHNDPSWLYSHGYDDWKTDDLLEDDMEEVFGDHTTAEFFEEAFVVWPGYKLAEDDDGNIIIIKDR